MAGTVQVFEQVERAIEGAKSGGDEVVGVPSSIGSE